MIGRNSNRFMGLVDDLLLIAEIEGGQLRTSSCPSCGSTSRFRDAVASARPLADEKGPIYRLMPRPTLESLGRPLTSRSGADNLVSNAIKFTPTGGTVRLSSSSAGGHAVVEVTDSGIGIPLAEQAQMFGRFFRSSSARAAEIPGTGLGLAITRGIVESHGGAIGFETEEGVGTTFHRASPSLVSSR